MTRSFATASLLTGAWVLVVAGPFQAAAQSPQPPKPGCSLPRFDPPDPARSRGIRFEGGAQSASGASFTATTVMPIVLVAAEMAVVPPLLALSTVTRVSLVPSNAVNPPP